MEVLIVSATFLEIKNVITDLKFNKISDNLYHVNFENQSIDILITGIGIAFTVYALTKTLSKKQYNLVINTGIAGSLSGKLKIGDLVQVTSEEFADLGIRSESSFSTLFEMGFIDKNTYPFSDTKLKNNSFQNTFTTNIQQVKGITVNTVNGNKNEIENIKNKFNADIESMEGAAFFYVCLMEKVPFIEIRAISNYVEERNKENWNIPLAINNLTTMIKKILAGI